MLELFECQDTGHAWKVVHEGDDEEWPGWARRELLCTKGCDCIKVQWIAASGETETRYRYSQAYRQREPLPKQQIRQEVYRRILGQKRARAKALVRG